MSNDAAFPHIAADGHRDYRPGMTTRDYFAAQALAGLVANPGGPFQRCESSGWTMVNCDQLHVAKECYRLADAMMDARSPQENASE
jgi:hypothetical protein